MFADGSKKGRYAFGVAKTIIGQAMQSGRVGAERSD